ncbi:MAG: hypothetical protein K0Q74_385 [Gammaproteobacteria bacterium]|nr:hypothetical protein [Gammaproteobacteria bacterium]
MSTATMPAEKKLKKDILYRTIGALLITTICLYFFWSSLDRSLWLDEAMLFQNYPISQFLDAFRPLRHYDQAATPLYNFFGSFISIFNVASARIFSFSLIVFLSSFLLLKNRTNWATIILAAVSLTLLQAPLQYFAEFKHYGFEYLGVIVLITWYINKESEKSFEIRDLFILWIGMFLGIATIAISLLILFLYFLERLIKAFKPKSKEIFLSLIFIISAISYFFCIRHVATYQIFNYPDAYRDLGGIRNLDVFYTNIKKILGGEPGVLLNLVAILLLLFNIKDKISYRFLLILFFTVSIFSFASYIGSYPVSAAKHVVWACAFCSTAIFFSIYISANNKYLNKIAATTLFITSLFFSYNVLKKPFGESFDTENEAATKYLSSLNPSDVGLWVGGQPILEFYQRHNKDLLKHRYFNFINTVSTKNEFLGNMSPDNLQEIEKHRLSPGGWGRWVQYRMFGDFKWPGRTLVSEAPRGKIFYIFASHYSHVSENNSNPRAEGLHFALEEAGCEYVIDQIFKSAVIYKVWCGR